MRIIEHTEGHYETQDVEYGKGLQVAPGERYVPVQVLREEANPHSVFPHQFVDYL